MGDKIHIQFSLSRVLCVSVITFTVIAFAVLSVALLPLIPSSERQDRAHENMLDDAYRALPTDSNKRDRKLREIEKKSLEIAHRTDNPIIKASAFADAGIAILRGYQEAVGDYKRVSAPVVSRRSSLTRVDSAIEYLEKSARICVEQGDHTLCPWDKIQRNFDGAHAFLSRDSQKAKNTKENDKEVSADSPKGEKKDQERDISRQEGEGLSQDVATSVSEVDELGGMSQEAPKGSMRGVLSEVPQDPNEDSDEGPNEGGGAVARPLQP